jgi:hypothetical protein
MKKVPIRLHTANALKWLGSLYRNPADAIKEHVSNAIDEHQKAKALGSGVPICTVTFALSKSAITIEYPYGMSYDEFRQALQRVADSAKRTLSVNQIGQLGIGMFSFLQLGKKCTFFSKKQRGNETTKVTLREGSDEAEFETATKKESLPVPGIKISIEGLLFDPTKTRGPLSPEKLQKVFSEKFDSYLKSGTLEIHVAVANGKPFRIEPLKIESPRVGEAYRNWALSNDQAKKITLELYYDPAGKGKVSIRHSGVSIVDDIHAVSAYGLEESVYAGGFLTGFIDCDFLRPLPARAGFEENEDWIRFLDELDKLRPSIEAEVEALKQKDAAIKLTEIHKKAIELAKEILNAEEFKSLELLEGMGRKPPIPLLPPHGFDFVPPARRIGAGEKGTLALKALVPRRVPDQSRVGIFVDDPISVKLLTDRLILEESRADKDGVVTVHVPIEGRFQTTRPVVLTARTGALKAEARIRVDDAKSAREPTGPGSEKHGPWITYEELPFEDGPAKHSRYVSRKVQINKLNQDYCREVPGRPQVEQLAYAILMIGKETIAFQDKSAAADEHLENLLSFFFRLKSRLSGGAAGIITKPPGRPRKVRTSDAGRTTSAAKA